jgi:hypothetical protein
MDAEVQPLSDARSLRKLFAVSNSQLYHSTLQHNYRSPRCVLSLNMSGNGMARLIRIMGWLSPLEASRVRALILIYLERRLAGTDANLPHLSHRSRTLVLRTHAGSSSVADTEAIFALCEVQFTTLEAAVAPLQPRRRDLSRSTSACRYTQHLRYVKFITSSIFSHYVMKPIYISIVHLRSQTTEEPNKQRLSLLSDYTLQYSHLHYILSCMDTDRNIDLREKPRGEANVVRGRLELCFLLGTTPLSSGMLLPSCCTLLSMQPPTRTVQQRVH